MRVRVLFAVLLVGTFAVGLAAAESEDPGEESQIIILDSAERPVPRTGPDPGSMGIDDPRQPQPEWLGEKVEVSDPSPQLGGLTSIQALFLAIGSGDPEQLGSLLARGVDVNARDSASGLTALMVADTLPMAKLLLEAGADVKATDNDGSTALHHVLFTEQVAVLLPLLLRHGAAVDAVAENRETPLLAARELFFEGRDKARAAQVFRLLVSAGADINAADSTGYTALITGAVNDKPELVRIALDLGADPSRESVDGKTALDYARELERGQVLGLLEPASR